jgi:hypothetical protein
MPAAIFIIATGACTPEAPKVPATEQGAPAPQRIGPSTAASTSLTDGGLLDGGDEGSLTFYVHPTADQVCHACRSRDAGEDTLPFDGGALGFEPVFRRHLMGLRCECWSCADAGTTSASITVHVVIDGSGHVSKVRAKGDDRAIGACLESEITRWSFATGPGSFDVPFRFFNGVTWPSSDSGAPFDRSAAAAALGAVTIEDCKTVDGPRGAGHVQVTFEPDGSAATAIVDVPFGGTAVGGCVAGRFRTARVPPFAGEPVTVGKTFAVE